MKRNGVGKWCLVAWQLERIADGRGVAGGGGVGGWSTSYEVCRLRLVKTMINIFRLVHSSCEDGRGEGGVNK